MIGGGKTRRRLFAVGSVEFARTSREFRPADGCGFNGGNELLASCAGQPDWRRMDIEMRGMDGLTRILNTHESGAPVCHRLLRLERPQPASCRRSGRFLFHAKCEISGLAVIGRLKESFFLGTPHSPQLRRGEIGAAPRLRREPTLSTLKPNNPETKCHPFVNRSPAGTPL